MKSNGRESLHSGTGQHACTHRTNGGNFGHSCSSLHLVLYIGLLNCGGMHVWYLFGVRW